MKRADMSRLVTLDLSPTEGAILVGLLEGVKKAKGDSLGHPVLELIDGTVQHIRLQLKQLNWPQGGHHRAPFPV